MSKRSREKQRPVDSTPVSAHSFNRRTFLKMASVIAGAGALSAIGLSIKHRPKLLTFQDIYQLPGVDRIEEIYGEKPDVIYFPFTHPNMSVTIQDNLRRGMGSIALICNTLYDTYGVRSLIPEGFTPEVIDYYNRIGQVELGSPNFSASALEDMAVYSNMLNTRKWNLKKGDDPEKTKYLDNLTSPLDNLGRNYSLLIKQKEAEFKILASSKKIPIEVIVERAQVDLDSIRENFQHRVDEYLTPERLKEITYLSITDRNQDVCIEIASCKKEGKLPVIVLFGDAHMKGLKSLFRSNGFGYASIYPNGFSVGTNADSDEESQIRESYKIPSCNISKNN